MSIETNDSGLVAGNSYMCLEVFLFLTISIINAVHDLTVAKQYSSMEGKHTHDREHNVACVHWGGQPV